MSLVCSAFVELLEAKLKMRAKDLEKGIANLLKDPELTQRIYGHPLVKALYLPGEKPSYIPSGTFSLALWNIASGASGSTGVTPRLQDIRKTVETTLPADTRTALLTLIDEAGNSLPKARQNVERWYEDTMDRVSGWYKRRTQWILLAVGLTVAAALNVDSITLVNSLSQDAAMRSALVATAEGYAANPPAQDKDPRVELDKNLEKIQSLGLPIGWVVPTTPEEARNLRAIPNGGWAWLSKVLGLLVTAFAISLGAPFWFDLLNKFMVVRSTIKPREKSSETPSKDKQAPDAEEDEGEAPKS
jgi:hypothetical protein